MIRVAIADDHTILREGLVALINLQPKTRVIIEAGNGAELLESMKADPKPDVVLLDLEMPGVDGKQALKVIVNKYPDVKVLILSMHTQLDFIHESIYYGAHGFLTKDSNIEKITDAIYAVTFKGFYFDNVVSKALVASVKQQKTIPVNTLDEIDIQIIEMICNGKTSKEIAELVFLGERTIEGRRLRIHKKTETNNLVELVVYAIKHKIFLIY
jgi:DNA-binding NarL/FixJ family response regulator